MSQPYPAIAVPDLFPSIDAIGRVRPRSRRSDLRGPSRIADGSSSAAFGIASAQTGVKCLASDEANQHPDSSEVRHGTFIPRSDLDQKVRQRRLKRGEVRKQIVCRNQVGDNVDRLQDVPLRDRKPNQNNTHPR
jgi:hypothetical protein